MSTARTIIYGVQVELLDLDGVRWPAADLVQYLNDGQRDIAVRRPDEVATTREVPLVVGARQTLAADVIALIDIPRNATGRKRSITKVAQQLLDSTDRDWQGRTGAAEIQHFMHDLREPRVFLVYPPAIGAAAAVQLVASVYPTEIPAPTTPAWDSVTGDIGIPMQWANALRHYILFRAFSKDGESEGNAALAASHYGLYGAALGEQLQSTTTVAPTT